MKHFLIGTALSLFAGGAWAGTITFDFSQIGDDVVISYAGALDTEGLKRARGGSYLDALQSVSGIFGSWGSEGDGLKTAYLLYTDSPQVPVFGDSYAIYRPTSSEGAPISIRGTMGYYGGDAATSDYPAPTSGYYYAQIWTTLDYVSGTDFAGSATYANQTLAGMGINAIPVSFSFGQNTIHYTLNAKADMAPVPLPAGAPLLLAGLGGLAVMRRRKKNTKAAH